ncbi:hypothetical protein [Ruminococcus sp.]|uniref:hypothetical protein n=1 Tax=Ruminococcus sp. TaxID=41978 RepID=UPI002E75EAEF|nr:hypothetical protein [Ruminococcus sp.]MEE1263033.1 hypothetical protein [Ruminococcus sp.]
MNDIDMLKCIAQNAEMGCQGVTAVRKRIDNKAVDDLLLTQLTRYGKIFHAAGQMLRNRGESVHHISPVAKTMTRLSAQMDLRRDSTPSHVAEMMIKGSTMGVNKLVHNLREYDRADSSVTLLAKKLLDTEEEHIRELRAFV